MYDVCVYARCCLSVTELVCPMDSEGTDGRPLFWKVFLSGDDHACLGCARRLYRFSCQQDSPLASSARAAPYSVGLSEPEKRDKILAGKTRDRTSLPLGKVKKAGRRPGDRKKRDTRGRRSPQRLTPV